MSDMIEKRIREIEGIIGNLGREVAALRSEWEQMQRNAGVQQTVTATVAGMPRCTACGAPLESGAFFCTNCGTRIQSAPQNAVPTPAVPPVPAPAPVPVPSGETPAAPAPAPAPEMSPEIKSE